MLVVSAYNVRLNATVSVVIWWGAEVVAALYHADDLGKGKVIRRIYNGPISGD